MAVGTFYGPTLPDLIDALDGIADHVHARMVKLQAAPSASEALGLAIDLDGARYAVLRIRERLVAEDANAAS